MLMHGLRTWSRAACGVGVAGLGLWGMAHVGAGQTVTAPRLEVALDAQERKYLSMPEEERLRSADGRQAVSEQRRGAGRDVCRNMLTHYGPGNKEAARN